MNNLDLADFQDDVTSFCFHCEKTNQNLKKALIKNIQAKWINVTSKSNGRSIWIKQTYWIRLSVWFQNRKWSYKLQIQSHHDGSTDTNTDLSSILTLTVEINPKSLKSKPSRTLETTIQTMIVFLSTFCFISKTYITVLSVYLCIESFCNSFSIVTLKLKVYVEKLLIFV